MIWKYLSKSILQEKVGEPLLDRLETVSPALPDLATDPLKIYTKNNLILIYNAFCPRDCFKNKKFMATVLNSVPYNKLEKLCESTGVGIVTNNFKDKVAAHLRKGWVDKEYCQKFIEWAELTKDFIPVEKCAVPDQELFTQVSKPFKVLKDYQYDVYARSIEMLDVHHERFVIQMPTGSGKTRTAMEFITQFINCRSENCVVVWLAHSQELCEQSMQCFKEVWSHVSNKPLRTIRCWGEHGSLPYSFSESAFIVAGFQKLHSLFKKNKIPFQELKRRVALIIVDEAHRVLAPTYKEVTKALLGSSTRLVGLTATPGRSVVHDDENKRFSEFFFNKIVNIETRKNESVIELLKKKRVISKTTVEYLVSGRTIKLSGQELTSLEKYLDFPQGFLKRVGADDIRNFEIIRRLYKECKENRSIMFFSCSVEHSRFICSVLLYLGYKAAHIDASTETKMRSSTLSDFKSKKIQILCNYEILSTGFDAPKTDVVFISRPTNSLVLYSQMIGRGLRGPAIGGTEHCKVINVKDDLVGVKDVDYIYEYFDDYWNE